MSYRTPVRVQLHGDGGEEGGYAVVLEEVRLGQVRPLLRVHVVQQLQVALIVALQ